MRHLDDGVLRRMGDEPIAIRDSERGHYAACARCRQRRAEIENDAEFVEMRLALPAVPVDTGAALATVQRRIESAGWKPRRGRPSVFAGMQRRARRGVAGGIGVLVIAAGLAFTPAGSLAQDAITVFQPSQVTPVSITAGDVQTLQELTQYGTLSGVSNAPAQDVDSVAAASQRTGMTVLSPSSLPADVPSNVRYAVLPSETASFTFSAAKAQAAAAASGQTLPPMPADIDGSTLEVTTGAAAITAYGAGSGSIPGLVIGQMRRPTLTARGVTVQQLEEYLLSLPTISEGLKAQIRAIGDPTTALPIPIPATGAYSHPVQVQGVQGLAVGDSTGTGSGVVWEKDGVIYGVAGPLSEDEVLSIANGLHE